MNHLTYDILFKDRLITNFSLDGRWCFLYRDGKQTLFLGVIYNMPQKELKICGLDEKNVWVPEHDFVEVYNSCWDKAEPTFFEKIKQKFCGR